MARCLEHIEQDIEEAQQRYESHVSDFMRAADLHDLRNLERERADLLEGALRKLIEKIYRDEHPLNNDPLYDLDRQMHKAIKEVEIDG